MKILLVGEFSSFHKYLKDGLESLGHDVVLASTGDTWKQIPGTDIQLFSIKGKNKISKALSGGWSAYRIAQSLTGYDVVQFVNPRLYPDCINWFMNDKIIKGNGLVSLCAVGGDMALYDAHRKGLLTQYALDYDNKLRYLYSGKNIFSKYIRRNEQRFVDRCNIIISGSYEYIVGYQDMNTKNCFIPMPCSVDKITYQDNLLKDKVVLFHGISRPREKGSPFILEALKRIKKKYGNLVEIHTYEKLPFTEYVKVMSKTNIVIDQCCCYGYGINALIAMAQGKIVLSGARPEMRRLIDEECPIVSILPDVNQIEDAIEQVIEHRNEFVEFGRQSRSYVEKVHNSKKIASQYVNIWSKLQ